jgi:MGT family glycosyltransferase
MSIPYVHIWNVLHLDFSGATPASVFSCPLDSSQEGLNRNAENLRKLSAQLGPLAEIARSYAEKVGLNIDWNDPAANVSKLAVITQTPKEFDFPGISWPAQFHYAGPFHDDEGRGPVLFPWERLTGKPLIFASLGTLVNGQEDVYKQIVKAVEPLEDVQVVLSVGKNIDPKKLGPVPSNTIVVRSAPQIELLKRAALCITHAGLNTVLESLAHGVPMVAIPIGYDQPGTAARIAHHGVGEFIEVDELTTKRLMGLIEKVLQDPSYRERADYFQKVISKTRGLDVAADIIEQAFHKYQTEVPRRVGKQCIPISAAPVSAVTNDQQRTFVEGVRNGKTEWVDVVTGLGVDGNIEVFGDLKPGTEVIRNATDAIRPGQPVKTRSSHS